MTPLRFIGSTALAFAMALPTLPAVASVTPSFGGGIIALTDSADALVIDVKQGRSGTGLRGRDRDRDDDRGRGRGRDDKGKDDRGRGRGSDDGVKSSDDTISGSGRDKTRVPGGSGCDSARDILEHPECSAGTGGTTVPVDTTSGSGRDKVRIPGGSGCDDPEDMLEHPECRL